MKRKKSNYIPVRYILAILITLAEVAAVIGLVAVVCYHVPIFYTLAQLTMFFCVIRIISSNDNPDYKIPWLLVVVALPIVGFMLYFLFYSRKLKKKFLRRREEILRLGYKKDDAAAFAALEQQDALAASHARVLCRIADTHLFTDTKQTYFPSGEEMHRALLEDLKKAEKFIYMEYFIIEQGVFWNSIYEILKQKAGAGVEVRLVYDDIGCMCTLPGRFARRLMEDGIDAVPFSRLRGNADNEFNNRSHRKITVIDGRVGYTGGINIADEYINEIERYGHWKDTAIRLEGEAVWEMCELFLFDYGINVKRMPALTDELYPKLRCNEAGYVIPFGDGPHPIYTRRVGKTVIRNMLDSAVRYVYITTPYLIIDNDLCLSIESAALRGVDVRIAVPHVPDKKLIFGMTRSFYHRLMEAGVKIYEYTPGFIHAKSYLCDDVYGMIGTINLDYRSLVHHFENGVWLYRCSCLGDLKADMEETMDKSVLVTPDLLRTTLLQRFVRAVVKIFSPLL